MRCSGPRSGGGGGRHRPTACWRAPPAVELGRSHPEPRQSHEGLGLGPSEGPDDLPQRGGGFSPCAACSSLPGAQAARCGTVPGRGLPSAAGDPRGPSRFVEAASHSRMISSRSDCGAVASFLRSRRAGARTPSYGLRVLGRSLAARGRCRRAGAARKHSVRTWAANSALTHRLASASSAAQTLPLPQIAHLAADGGLQWTQEGAEARCARAWTG